MSIDRNNYQYTVPVRIAGTVISNRRNQQRCPLLDVAVCVWCACVVVVCFLFVFVEIFDDGSLSCVTHGLLCKPPCALRENSTSFGLL
jgi:hypothetical protein